MWSAQGHNNGFLTDFEYFVQVQAVNPCVSIVLGMSSYYRCQKYLFLQEGQVNFLEVQVSNSSLTSSHAMFQKEKSA